MELHKIEHVLNSYPPNDGESAANYRTRMNTASVEVTDQTPYTWSGLSLRLQQMSLPIEAVVGFEMMLPGVTGGTLLDKCLSSGGVDFSQASIQQALDGIETTEQTAPIVAAIKAVGKRDVSPWAVMLGSGQSCSAEDATAVVAAKNKADLESAARTRWGAVWNAIQGGTVTTEAEVIAKFGE